MQRIAKLLHLRAWSMLHGANSVQIAPVCPLQNGIFSFCCCLMVCIWQPQAVIHMVQVKTVGDIVTVVPTAGSTATVLVSDLSACKAYVQVIDTVLIPAAVGAPSPPDCASVCMLAALPVIWLLPVCLPVCLPACLFVRLKP